MPIECFYTIFIFSCLAVYSQRSNAVHDTIPTDATFFANAQVWLVDSVATLERFIRTSGIREYATSQPGRRT